MAFSDPQSITISGTAISLPRTNVGDNGSEYTSADGLTKLKVQSFYGRRTRRQIRLDLAKVAADPYLPAQNVRVSSSMYLVVDVPPAGYSNTELLAAWTGFNTLLTANTNASVSKVLGGES